MKGFHREGLLFSLRGLNCGLLNALAGQRGMELKLRKNPRKTH